MHAERRYKKRQQILSKGPRAGDRMPTMFGISTREMNRDELLSCVFEMQQTILKLREQLDQALLDNKVY